MQAVLASACTALELGYARPVTARTPRERTRLAVLEELKAVARSQLEERGAAALSLRHVARDVGLSSSGVYRYVESRDELLTLLIVEAYDGLGEAVERAEAAVARDDLFGRWWASACALRAWARVRPQEYGLVFGSPVPGYEAPPTTVGPASRVPLVLSGILRDAAARMPSPAPDAGAGVDATHSFVAVELAGLSTELVARGVLAWVTLFGLVSFELFGHLSGTVSDNDAYFRWACERAARTIGIEV